MKKILLSSLIAAAAAVPAIAGVDNINYQAVIKNGKNVVADTEVAMKFELLDKAQTVVYSEEQTPKTNASGFVACQLGKDDALSTIEWGDLTLRVSINLGNGFEVISNEAVSSVPTALYALRSADSDEIKEVVEELMLDNESNKISILGINAELVKMNGFVDEVDAFNNDLVEKLEPMMGLNYEEINDFHERITTEVINLNDFKEAAEQNLQDINDELAKLQGLNTEEISDFHQRVSETLSALNEKVDEMDEFNQTVSDALAKLQGLDAEEVEDQFDRLHTEIISLQTANEELNTNTEAFATMVETRIDKVQNQVDGLDGEVSTINDTLNQLIEALRELDILPTVFK